MYELWDANTGNLLDSFLTEAAALAAVRDFLIDNGRSTAEALGIVYEDRRGRSKLIAEGAALLELAQRSGPDKSAARAS
jgi:hypothetical protein